MALFLRCNCSSWEKKLYGPFYGWSSIASGQEPLRGGGLIFITNFPEISGTHFINLGRMKD